jgi:hypothetical protein
MISHVCYKAMDAPNCFGSCIFVHLRLTPQLFGIHVYEQTDSNRVRHVTHYCFSSYMNTLSVSRFEWGQYGASQKGMKVFRYSCIHQRPSSLYKIQKCVFCAKRILSGSSQLATRISTRVLLNLHNEHLVQQKIRVPVLLSLLQLLRELSRRLLSFYIHPQQP